MPLSTGSPVERAAEFLADPQSRRHSIACMEESRKLLIGLLAYAHGLEGHAEPISATVIADLLAADDAEKVRLDLKWNAEDNRQRQHRQNIDAINTVPIIALLYSAKRLRAQIAHLESFELVGYEEFQGRAEEAKVKAIADLRVTLKRVERQEAKATGQAVKA